MTKKQQGNKRRCDTSSMGAALAAQLVKNTPANAGDTKDEGLIPGLGRFPGEEMATRSSILACKPPRTEEPGGLRSMGSQRVRHN